MSARADELAARRRRTEMVAGLRKLARGGSGEQSAADQPRALVERCDMCGTTLPDDHRHVLHLVDRRILCSCEACWALRSGEAELRPVGQRVVWLPDLALDDETWGRFQIPIGLAFLMRSTLTGTVVAMYPSPAGATESELDMAAWEELVQANPELERLEPDAEGLIVNRLATPHEHVVAPIDQCYKLVGLIKLHWEGISGGEGLERALREFFGELREKAAA